VIDHDGFAIVDSVLDSGTVGSLLHELEQVERGAGVSRREQVYAIRHLLQQVPAVQELANSPAVRFLVEPVLGPTAFAVQGIFFDKPAGSNWKVPWHQDRSIPVKGRVEIPGFGPWSVKAGVLHVQPPAQILEQMLIVRLHLDDCGEDNGPLRVIPGSHLSGKLDPTPIEHWRSRGEETVCIVAAGGALLMRPLLLHASSTARIPAHRRVIHLVYAADPLPDGLAWHADCRRGDAPA
jgi:ectoine hydroxylase-related dioxygenase (phytanoyl-CoA dioxygenase family)